LFFGSERRSFRDVEYWSEAVEMKLVEEHIMNFFFNRVGLILVIINLLLVLCGWLLKGENFNTFHFYYEALPIKIFCLLNLPAIFLGDLIMGAFFPAAQQSSDMFEFATPELVIIGVLSILQWLVIGRICGSGFKRKSS